VKIYRGVRTSEGCRVFINEQCLCPRLDLRTHRPSDFEWGYGGSGPSQLALALLADALEDDERAQALYMEFTIAVVARLPKAGWSLTQPDIVTCVSRLEEVMRAEQQRRDHEYARLHDVKASGLMDRQ
jgi:hypothetical protein